MLVQKCFQSGMSNMPIETTMQNSKVDPFGCAINEDRRYTFIAGNGVKFDITDPNKGLVLHLQRNFNTNHLEDKQNNQAPKIDLSPRDLQNLLIQIFLNDAETDAIYQAYKNVQSTDIKTLVLDLNAEQVVNFFRYKILLDEFISSAENKTIQELGLNVTHLYAILADLNSKYYEDKIYTAIHPDPNQQDVSAIGTLPLHNIINFMNECYKVQSKGRQTGVQFVKANMPLLLQYDPIELHKKGLQYTAFTDAFSDMSIEKWCASLKHPNIKFIFSSEEFLRSALELVNLLNYNKPQGQANICLIDLLNISNDYHLGKILGAGSYNGLNDKILANVRQLITLKYLTYEKILKLSQDEDQSLLPKVISGYSYHALIFLLDERRYTPAEIEELDQTLLNEIYNQAITIRYKDLDLHKKLKALPFGPEFIVKVNAGKYAFLRDKSTYELLDFIKQQELIQIDYDRYLKKEVHEIKDPDFLDFLRTTSLEHISEVNRVLSMDKDSFMRWYILSRRPIDKRDIKTITPLANSDSANNVDIAANNIHAQANNKLLWVFGSTVVATGMYLAAKVFNKRPGM